MASDKPPPASSPPQSPAEAGEKQVTVLDPATGLPPGWREREKTLLKGLKAGQVQIYYENITTMKKADGLKKLFKEHCASTGEDSEELYQRCQEIRTGSKPKAKAAAKAKAGAAVKVKVEAKEPKVKQEADAAAKAKVEAAEANEDEAKVKQEVPAAPPSKTKVKVEPSEASKPEAKEKAGKSATSKKRKKIEADLEKLDPETLLPLGWKIIQLVYKTGGSAGKPYTRFQRDEGGMALGSLKQVFEKHLEETGEDLFASHKELKEERNQAAKEENARKQAEKGKFQKDKREMLIQLFRDKHGTLTGPILMAFPGWKGESKFLPSCGQYCASYQDPSGKIWKLCKDVEAHFGYLMEQGREDEIPDIELARQNLATDEKGKVINEARQLNKVEEFTLVNPEPDNSRSARRGKRKKVGTDVVNYDFYRDCKELRCYDIMKMSEQEMETANILEGASAVKQLAGIKRGLLARHFPESTAVIYMRGPWKKAVGQKTMKLLEGFYYERPDKVDERSCYQQITLVDQKLVCTECHLFWSAKLGIWKLGRVSEDKAGIAICSEDQAQVLKLTQPWKLYEPREVDVSDVHAEEAPAAQMSP